MKRFSVLLWLSACAVGISVPLAARSAPVAKPVPASSALADTSAQRALLDRYCVTCHGSRMKAAGLELDKFDLAKLGEHAEVGEKVVRKLRGGLMPPRGLPRPDAAAYEGLTTWLESQLDAAAGARPNPGRKPSMHRLNRAEYHNAVRDLLNIDADVTDLLPPDDASYGFENMAGVLKLSPALIERYLTAARKISRSAWGLQPPAPSAVTFKVSDEVPQGDRLEGLPFGTRGGATVRFQAPQDAEYEFSIEFVCSKVETEGCDAIGGFPDEHQLEIAVDGARMHLFTLEPKRRMTAPGGGGGIAETPRLRARVAMKTGLRDISVTFIKLPSIEEADGVTARYDKPMLQAPWIAPNMALYQPAVEKVTITGPFVAGVAQPSPIRSAILTCKTTTDAQKAACARETLSRLARRAYRRPVTARDVDKLFAFYEKGRADGGFEAGMDAGLRALLVSPQFLFRTEVDPPQATPGTNYRISDLELASRLSFFLWSTIPDDELLATAVQGRLHDPVVLERQVHRMLADPRATSLTTNFAVQWLQLPKLEGVRPSGSVFPNFDESLRAAFRKETELFFESILREDRSLVDLLTADYTFVNERLARHYEIPNVRGSDFRRVALPADSPRRGLLGQGSILTLTSQAIRTSPVVRGKWIMVNILGTPPPDPPANVPPLPEKKGDAARVLTMRERMAEHRSNPVCATCHSMIDPLGFALENFDAVGRYRTVDETFAPVDASGTLPDGSSFVALPAFRQNLLRHPERFVNSTTQKLLTYALGRGTEYYDMPLVRKIVREAGPSQYKLSAVILGVVKSDAFQMRQAVPQLAGTAAMR